MVLGDVVYLGQLSVGRVRVVGVRRVDAHRCGGSCVVLQNGVLHRGDGRAGGHRHSRLLDVDLLQGGGRGGRGQIGGREIGRAHV